MLSGAPQLLHRISETICDILSKPDLVLIPLEGLKKRKISSPTQGGARNNGIWSGRAKTHNEPNHLSSLRHLPRFDLLHHVHLQPQPRQLLPPRRLRCATHNALPILDRSSNRPALDRPPVPKARRQSMAREQGATTDPAIRNPNAKAGPRPRQHTECLRLRPHPERCHISRQSGIITAVERGRDRRRNRTRTRTHQTPRLYRRNARFGYPTRRLLLGAWLVLEHA